MNPNGEWRQLGPGKYQKYNPMLGIRTTVIVEPSPIAGKVTLRTLHEQRVDDIVEANKRQQNEFKGFRNDLLTQTSRIPLVEWNGIMRKCGQDRTGRYDQKKFRQILNDPDYKYFKTIDKRL